MQVHIFCRYTIKKNFNSKYILDKSVNELTLCITWYIIISKCSFKKSKYRQIFFKYRHIYLVHVHFASVIPSSEIELYISVQVPTYVIVSCQSIISIKMIRVFIEIKIIISSSVIIEPISLICQDITITSQKLQKLYIKCYMPTYPMTKASFFDTDSIHI